MLESKHTIIVVKKSIVLFSLHLRTKTICLSGNKSQQDSSEISFLFFLPILLLFANLY